MDYYEKYKPRMNELEAFNMVSLRIKHIKLNMLLDWSGILLNFFFLWGEDTEAANRSHLKP